MQPPCTGELLRAVEALLQGPTAEVVHFSVSPPESPPVQGFKPSGLFLVFPKNGPKKQDRSV